MDNSEKDRVFKERQRRRIEFQKKADANVTIKNGKRVINSVSTKNKAKQGKQQHGRSNDAGSGLNPQQRKTKEDRKLKNVQDITNENASIITACTDNSSVKVLSLFKTTKKDLKKEPSAKKTKKKPKLSKIEQMRLQNTEKMLQKEIIEEKRIISKIKDCNSYEEIYKFYVSIKHEQVVFLFEILLWCEKNHNKILKMNSSSKKKEFLSLILNRIKTILLHIDDRNVETIPIDYQSTYENCKSLTNGIDSIEVQLKGIILPKPMNDFKDISLKADLWQKEVIYKIDEGNNVVVLAPTATGKTIIGTYMGSRDGWTLFIVPNESVAVQVTGVMSSFAKDGYCLLTKKLKVITGIGKMIIGTPIEVEQYLVETGKYHFDNIIIDEIHCLNNEETYENIEYANSIKKLMILLKGQFLFLSATLTDESISNLKTYIEDIQGDCEIVKHSERFINLQFCVFTNQMKIKPINSCSQIELSEIEEFKNKNLSFTNEDIWRFWEASLDEDEFDEQMEHWFEREKLLDLNDIQKNTKLIKKFITHQAKHDPEFINDVLEEVGSNVTILEIDKTNEKQYQKSLLNLIQELKENDLLPAIMFQNDVSDCYDTHRIIVEGLEIVQDIEFPTYYQDKKREAKEYEKLQSKIQKMQESSSKVKCSNKQDRDNAHKAREQKLESQKEQISNMREQQYSINRNVHAPHPKYACAPNQITDDGMREIRFKKNLKAKGYETIEMRGIQRGVIPFTSNESSMDQHINRQLILDKHVGFVIADKSLAYGVNFPFRTVINEYDGNTSSQTILQQIGRAGRRGFDTQGNVIFYKIKDSTKKNPVKEILMAKFPTIKPELEIQYFSYTEMIKPFCIFETKKKADIYLEQLHILMRKEPINFNEESINDRFISLINHVVNNESLKNDYLEKIIWLIDSFKVNLPKYARILCSNSYTKDKNISSIIMFLLLPFIKETFCNIKGIGHSESRELFSIFSSLYDINKTDEVTLLDTKYSNYLDKCGFTETFGNNIMSYDNYLYSIYVSYELPKLMKDKIVIKMRFSTINEIIENLIKVIEDTEFITIKPLLVNVNGKLIKLIQKCDNVE